MSLLHAYANPAHEEALGERLRARFPFVALSHRVNPEAREYERMATTALSAGVMPLAASYLDDLEGAKPQASGCTCSIPPAAWHRRRRCAACRSASPRPVLPPASPPPAAWPARSGWSAPSASTWAAPPPMSA